MPFPSNSSHASYLTPYVNNNPLHLIGIINGVPGRLLSPLHPRHLRRCRCQSGTFTITNNCGYTLWPAGIPVGGGTQLDQGQTWTVDVPAGTSGRFWGRTSCSFNGGNEHCDSGDCAGALSCTVSGQTPATLAEYTIGASGAQDFYDISLVDGFNLAVDFSCSTGVALHCGEPGCRDAYLYPTDDTKTHSCSGNSNYQVTFRGP